MALFRKERSTKKRTTQAPPSSKICSPACLRTRAIEYPVVIKGDVQGSVEAIVNCAQQSVDRRDQGSHPARRRGRDHRNRHAAGGGVECAADRLQRASRTAKARELLAKRDKVRLKYFDVIYHLTADIAKEMAGELGPEIIETVVGRAEVKDVFKSGKRDKAAGLLVTEGVIKKGLFARLTREDVIVSKTTIASLRRFKDDVDEVRAGLECGVVLADTNDVKAGDMLEVFEVEERERTL